MTTSITFYTNSWPKGHKQHVPFTVSVPTTALVLDRTKQLMPNIATLTDESFLQWCHDSSQASEVLKLNNTREAATLLLLRTWHLAPGEIQKNVKLGKAIISAHSETVVSNSLLVYSAVLGRGGGLPCPLYFFDYVSVSITRSTRLLGLVLDQVKTGITVLQLLDIEDTVLRANPVTVEDDDAMDFDDDVAMDPTSYKAGDVVDYGSKKTQRGTIVAVRLSSAHGIVYDVMNHANSKVDKGRLAINMQLVSRPGNGSSSTDEESDTLASGSTSNTGVGVHTRARLKRMRKEASSSSSPGSRSSRPTSKSILPIVPSSIACSVGVRSYGEGDTFYVPNFLSANEADAFLAALHSELEPYYVDRRDPTVQFSIFGKINGVARDKAALGDVNGNMAPLYRYGAPELAQVVLWTTLHPRHA